MATKIAILVLTIMAFQALCATGDQVNVTFWLAQRAQYGQIIRVVGNSSGLFNWDINFEPCFDCEIRPAMTWTRGNVWKWTTYLEGGASYEYKAVVLNYNSGACICMMPGDNRVLTLPSSEDSYVEFMEWDPSCGTSYSCFNRDACSVGDECPSDFIHSVTA